MSIDTVLRKLTYRVFNDKSMSWDDVDKIHTKAKADLLKLLLEKLPEKRDIDYWLKKLDVDTSDWAYGHMRGYNQAIEDFKEVIDKLFGGKE